ncbi:Peroxisomal adenine nucleotide transporter 1 [Fusarium oxysporum f. sp. albedinis]|nr:Peroxisomal adenine nucleotide transporter 1 [Fusarium oxysporum f. sp. albedinis]
MLLYIIPDSPKYKSPGVMSLVQIWLPDLPCYLSNPSSQIHNTRAGSSDQQSLESFLASNQNRHAWCSDRFYPYQGWSHALHSKHGL